MPKILRPLFCLLLVAMFSVMQAVLAQTPVSTNQGNLADQNTQIGNSNIRGKNAVFGSVADNRIRFSALGELLHLRLEVIAPTGELLFDSGFKSGNLVDWLAADGNGQALAEGTYLCVVTVKDATGKHTKHRALMGAHDQTVSLKQNDHALLAPAQSEAGGETGDQTDSVTILEAGGVSATVTLAHDGSVAHLVSASGGLSISSGNFFAGKVMEQVRLTAEGNLGIGIPSPQVRLDVAGRIRASEGIVFPDGSVQFSASRKTLGAASLRPGDSQHTQGENGLLAPETSGTGTTGKLAKWLDGPNGVLGDANLADVSGALGVNGTPDTRFRLDVNGSTRLRGSNPGFNLEGLRAAGNIWAFQTVDDDGRFRLFGQDNVNPGVERLTIKLDTGNVGIGKTNPTARLDVGGTIKAVGYYTGNNQMLVLGGVDNLYVGPQTGASNSTGAKNTFVGDRAGQANDTGSDNTFVGKDAGVLNTEGSRNTLIGKSAGFSNQTGNNNTMVGEDAGISTTGSSNTFIGLNAGQTNTTGSNNTVIGSSANVFSSNLHHATAIGSGALVSDNDSIVLGRSIDAVRIPGAVLIDGSLVVRTLGSAGSTQVCLNSADRFAPCSSSLRYKTNVQSFFGGLDVVKRLRPITFNWKDGGMQDVGFGAEEVEKIEPRLTIRNKQGEIEGVKYAQLTTLLVNAVNEQQSQIETLEKQNQAQQKQLERQQLQLDSLKQIVCSRNPRIAMCK
jgi:hypothetical protein